MAPIRTATSCISTSSMLALALLGLTMPSEARIGAGRELTESDIQAQSMHGFDYYSSTTIYGDTPMTACGSLNTVELVRGTDYFAVASAQAMQAVFPDDVWGAECRWECQTASGESIERCDFQHPPGSMSMSKPVAGCSCRQIGACMCGKAGPNAGPQTGTAPMGCFQCGRGQFLKRHPYHLTMANGHETVGETIKVVVADICPYGPNTKWCPGVAGETNAVGVKNHLDFATMPQGVDYKNNFFVFTPEPCDNVLMDRMHNMTTCPSHTFPSNGDLRI
mmetsp:Transcript_20316/g.44329  ORF Transcript_20316/g.44329 Transcript_20316/m.44329 type:complete len:278 (+) Transcript_20316:253-1086(+)